MIPAKRAHLHVTAATHPGMKGKSNEDRFAVSAHRLGPKDATPSVVAIIADGIGGHRAGEVAAEMAVEVISHAIAESNAAQPTAILRQALTQASQMILNQSRSDPAQAGMGTTCVCAWIIGDRLYAATAGDSRLYLIRGKGIQCLTTDHTWVQEALEHGALTTEQARDHPNSHIIRRYLGSKHGVKPDLRLRMNPSETNEQAEANQGMHLLPGDCLLLCSDGLTDLVEDDEILAALQVNGREQALASMIDLANTRGGHDNITIVSLEMPASETTWKSHPLPDQSQIAKKTSPSGLARHRTVLSCMIITAMTAAALLLAAGLIWYLTRPTPTLPTPTQPAITWTAPTPLPTFTPPPSATLAPSSTSTPRAVPSRTYTPWPTNTITPTP